MIRVRRRRSVVVGGARAGVRAGLLGENACVTVSADVEESEGREAEVAVVDVRGIAGELAKATGEGVLNF